MEEEQPVQDAQEALEKEVAETSTKKGSDSVVAKEETIVSELTDGADNSLPVGDQMEVDDPSSTNEQSESPFEEPVEKSSFDVEGDGLSRNQTRLIVGGVVIVVILIIVGLFLPPISLAERLGIVGNGDEQTLAESTDEPEVEDEKLSSDGIGITPSDVSTRVKVKKIDQDKFLEGDAGEEWLAALEGIPASLSLSSDVYKLDYKDEPPIGSAQLVIPANAQPYQTLDLYGWDGSEWQFFASQVSPSGNMLSSDEEMLPLAFALMQTSSPTELAISAEVLPAQVLPATILPHLTDVSVGTLTLNEGGQLQGDLVAVPSGSYRQFLRATNTGVIVDSITIASLLESEESRHANIQALVDRAYGSGYAGVNLDYQGIPREHRGSFTSFVEELASNLEQEGLELALTLETPVLLEGEWDTAGQDWAALGQTADVVYVQMPLDPTSYNDNGEAQAVLEWATRQIERNKLLALLSSNAIDAVGDARREIEAGAALENFGELEFITGSTEVDAGDPIEVALSGSAGDLAWDPDALTYKYTYELAGQPHEVWLGSEAILGHQGRFANLYHVRGLAVRGLGQLDDGTGYAAAIDSLQGQAETPQPESAAIVWVVEDESGGVVASSSGEDLTFSWEGSEVPGQYVVSADFAHGDNVITLGSLEISVGVLAESEPEDVVVEAELEIEDDEETEAEEPEAAPPGSYDPGDADAVVNVAANVRNGPGVIFGIIGGMQAGETVQLIGRNNDKTWYQVKLPDGSEGWIFGQLLTINTALDTGALAVVEVEAPVASAGSGAAPAPVIAPAGGGSFELGGQTHTLANPTIMQMAGMNWVKFQHKWGPGDNPSGLAGRIQQAHGNGMKVLLSIPGGSTYPSSIDFNGYVEFLRGVAALGPDAIEIWNEENIDFEWPAGQIDPASYVNNMLAPAYNAIKSANSSVMVISGAPAPTGYDNGTNAWADDRYMAGVAAAGGANYMDCIGVHHNAGATSPSASSGHPAGNNHYSWYFGPTLNMYYNAFGGSRPVCFTELGYLSGGDFGGVPSRFSWASNTTVAQHAQWLAEAASLAANSGRVRLMIIFNVDFTHWGDDPQAGYAMLRPDGSCPSCGLLGQVMGR